MVCKKYDRKKLNLYLKMGPRKFLHHGILRKSKSGKELVAFLLNDFLLLTVSSSGKPIGSGHQVPVVLIRLCCN
jgi:hypothetical protein